MTIATAFVAGAFAAPAANADTAPDRKCPPGSVCLYEDANFFGESLNLDLDGSSASRLRPFDLDAHSDDLPNMHDEVSSWTNNSGRALCVYDIRRGGQHKLLWRMNPHSLRTFVGTGANDRSDYLAACV